MNRVWRIVTSHTELKDDYDISTLSKEDKDVRRLIHSVMKKVTDDISQRFNFNTASAPLWN